MADVDTAPPTDVDVKEELREQPVVPHAAETDPETHTQAVTYELDADERVEREAAAVYKVISEAMRDGRRIFSFSLDNVHAIFQAVDADHDGLIDYPEFAEAMHQLDLGLSTQQMKDIFAFTDVDNSGGIDYAEFAQDLHQNHGAGAASMADAATASSVVERKGPALAVSASFVPSLATALSA